MPRQQRQRSKRWSFTLNNPTEAEESLLQGLVSSGQATFIVIGKERGESGTYHFQGYIEVPNKLSLSSIRSIIPRAHLEKSRGSAQSNIAYCTKEDNDAFKDGSPMSQGRRSDLEEIKESLDGGATMTEIAEQHFSKWVVYRRSFQAYMALKMTSRSWVTQVHVLWGKTGTGKTRFAHDQVMDLRLWTPGDYTWFDGYDGQEIVVLDDYRGEYPLQFLLKLLDRYAMTVPVKGAFVEWKPRKVYITSNVSPMHWYDSDASSLAALKRRFTTVEEIRTPLYEDILL